MTEEKYVYDDQPPVDEGFNRGAVAPHGSSMLAKPGEKGSLPVLEAFQEFLEEERKRSRNRMFILSAIFTLLLVCVIFCGLFIGSVYLSKMKDELRQVSHNSETELLRMQNENLRAMNNNRGNVIMPQQPQNNSGMSEGQKAQVSLMMQDSQAEINKLQAKIDQLQSQKTTAVDGPSNSAISNALVNVMREVSKMRKDINSGTTVYSSPRNSAYVAPTTSPVVQQPIAVKPVYKEPEQPVVLPQKPAPVVDKVAVVEPAEITPAVKKTPAVVEEKKEPLPNSISVTIKPDGQGIVCAVPMEL
ncbi:MAG: hypothetical protein PF692_09520 [Kiritimatiellae bacterium]|jgi:predicted nucleic acid-binding Zn ribbon protein|nr:hypothetical protein [Kiritimatiellia bacterium]